MKELLVERDGECVIVWRDRENGVWIWMPVHGDGSGTKAGGTMELTGVFG